MKVSQSCLTSKLRPADVGLQLGHLPDVLSGLLSPSRPIPR